ncbi:MAG: isoprenyl transferase [Eubacteriales bacterium]|nr:isoprenyl transferase [Eubacteriales bacterium]
MNEYVRECGLDGNIPRHVAIIMDGNGRWATKRGLPRSAGHRAGMEALRDLITASSELGIEALTLYAFSTENWKRPRDEVGTLFSLVVEYFNREISELHEKGVRIRVLGDMSRVPQKARAALMRAEDITHDNSGLKLNLAINYGARAELVRAAKALAEDVSNGGMAPDAIDEAAVSSRLYTSGQPDVDLLIRTGGEMRLSNFLLYQSAYAELLFTDTLFPDFDKAHYLDAIREFQGRSRRFGAIKQ